AAAQPSGKIDFPTCCGPNCVLSLIAVVAGKTIRNRTKWTHHALVQSCGRRHEIGCWQELSARCCSCRLALADTRKCSGKIEILIQRALNDRNKQWVVEARPSTVERRCR